MGKRRFFFFCRALVLPLVFLSCADIRIPTVPDYALERKVADEASPILRVTDDRNEAPNYRIRLSKFPRPDVLGMSVGDRSIYINYTLARLAFQNPYHRWLLRQILAHEIAHEIAGHSDGKEAPVFDRSGPHEGVTPEEIGLPAEARFQNYSMEKELEADLNGMKYWQALRWDCRIWVQILEDFQRQNYAGDTLHPTDVRLGQALQACP
ncbi:MAG TPA: hypothetical protein VGL11_11375 [Candidatus Binatia bacterium]